MCTPPHQVHSVLGIEPVVLGMEPSDLLCVQGKRSTNGTHAQPNTMFRFFFLKKKLCPEIKESTAKNNSATYFSLPFISPDPLCRHSLNFILEMTVQVIFS